NGVAGFGFAFVGTMVLAATLDPATAVAFMIVPMFAVNVALVGDLTREELRTCGTRFAPLLVAALVGTVVGMALLDRIPGA
ncbi:sulfite exporter TauE/SafE family protein, partial [Halorubrum sp. SS7]